MMRTRTNSGTIVETGVEHTSAAHVVVDDEPITVCWSTIPVACSDYLLGDISSQGPVHQPADQVPDLWRSSNSTRSDWQPRTEVQCGVCGQMIGPWALAEPGHLEGDELLDLAGEVAELADQQREGQRRKLIASLDDDAEDVAIRLADGDLELAEVPDLRAMAEPGVGIYGNQIVAWATLPALDGGDDPEIVEVTRPIPTGPAS
jgi:hypothetical protein